jgi:hypothetical protein
MGRWTITDDEGRVMTIEVPGDCLIVTLDAQFRTRRIEVAQDVHRKLGVAIGQLPRNDD